MLKKSLINESNAGPKERNYRHGNFSVALKGLSMKNLAIILIVIGGIMTVFTGFNIITKKEVVDIGALEINKEEKTPIYWSPITGIIILAAGVIILLTAKKRA